MPEPTYEIVDSELQVEMVKLADIYVPEDRMRAVSKQKVGELKDSIRRLGLLNPITLTMHSDHGITLVAGEHRMVAYTEMGYEEIPAIFRENIDAVQALEMELEENVMRNEMSPVERAKAIARINKLRSAKDPNWTQQQTAAVIGSKRQADVSDAIKVAQMLEVFPELADMKPKSFNQLKSWAEHKAKTVLRTADVAAAPKVDYSDIESRILLGDSRERIKEVPDESFHAIITDPPFGVDYDNQMAGTSGALTSYEDGKELYKSFLGMAPDLYRVLKPNGWLVWFFGMSWYGDEVPNQVATGADLRELAEKLEAGVHPTVIASQLYGYAKAQDKIRTGVKTAFRNAGFTVDELPIVWNRSGGRTFTSRPDRYFARGYDVAIMAFKGEPNVILRGKPNVLTIEPVSSHDRETLVERPTELYAELIRRLTVPGEVVADFFVGGGGCPAAAASLGRGYFGCELDPDRRAYAITKIKANTPTK